ncbi:phage portal protein [Salinispora pacifica]|uniref:phage portal protein n=1 Tax=Salinispora pacifica TaxID=351187 RepID=UPI00036A0C78|nr:phage portal protein [Salinispora pacifica]
MIGDPSPRRLAAQLLLILDRDADRLERIDNYMQGRHDDPYMPENSDDEYKLLAKRAISNWMPLLVKTPTQALYVDSFRHGDKAPSGKSPSWKHWQRSRLTARQIPVHRGALTYGHSFTVTEKTPRGVKTRGLSAMRTAALFEDPANDETPHAALTVTRKPADGSPGKATLWDGTHEYAVAFSSYTDPKSIRVEKGMRHGASECPVTRFVAYVDLEGRTVGVVEPMIPVQNRIGQTIFDLLVAQTYGSTKARWATGMAPPLKRDPETGEPILNEDGNPIPLPMNYNAKRFLFAEDETTKFGSFDETPLDGFISSVDMSIRHLSAISQTPPHHLLGQIANLSAEALLAAETALSRMVEEFRTSFGESWERVDRLAAELNNESLDDYEVEVIWRDMELKSLAQSADGLGKLAELLGIPKRGLWARVPGARQSELDEWERLYEEENADLAISQALRRSSPDRAVDIPATPDAEATPS